MNQAFNTAWIGFGWGQDVRVEGGAVSDAYTVTIHRARPGGGSFAWTGAPDPDGTLRVRIDGKDTAAWTAGVLPVSIRIQRGQASGVVSDLPPLVVKMPAVPADGSEPLISDRSKPLSLQLTGSDGGQIAVRLDAGIKGDKGDKGDTGDLTPELVAARDLAVASAASSSADALSTAGDRAATASDRAQVREDQIEVADDRTRTAADRVATAADRAQTGQDRTAVVGLRAETEAIRDSASGHRAAAQAAATASQSNRDATATDRVQTGQDRVSTTASATAAADDAAQTASDRVQTGQDRIAAANSATEAAKFDPAFYARKDGVQFTGDVEVQGAGNGLRHHIPGVVEGEWRLLDDGRLIWFFGGTIPAVTIFPSGNLYFHGSETDVLDSLNKRLRFDAAQSLAAGQALQALRNIGFNDYWSTLRGTSSAANLRSAIDVDRTGQAISTTGGDESGGISTAAAVRLQVDFVARSPAALISVSCSLRSLTSNLQFGYCSARVLDLTTGSTVGSSPEQVVSLEANASGRYYGASRALALSGLVIGNTHRAQLLLRGSVDNAAAPQGMQISGVN